MRGSKRQTKAQWASRAEVITTILISSCRLDRPGSSRIESKKKISHNTRLLLQKSAHFSSGEKRPPKPRNFSTT